MNIQIYFNNKFIELSSNDIQNLNLGYDLF